MHRQAGLEDWFKWMAQPISTIFQQHRDFVYGPVDDLMDEIIRSIAPELVKKIGEREIEEDMVEFTDGANLGRHHLLAGMLEDPSPGGTPDFASGYHWGYQNGKAWNGRELPRDVKSKVIDQQIQEFRKKVTEEVVQDLLEKTWHALSPANTIEAIIKAVKKHGWKLGVGLALFEVLEHAILPTVVIHLTGKPEMAVLGTLPIGEIVYAVALRVMGRTPKELDKVDPDGHLDWYESQYGPVRLASCQKVARSYAGNLRGSVPRR